MTVFQPLDTKSFMKSLLLSKDFDTFVLVEAIINANIRTIFEGTLNKDFQTDQDEKFIAFSEVKPLIVSLIKGKKTPAFLKIVLAISNSDMKTFVEENEESFHSSYPSALFLNIRFENGSLSVTSGSGTTDFDKEKMVDKTWDSYLRKFLTDKGLI